MSTKKQNKKLILTANFTGLPEAEKLQKMDDMTQAYINNPTIVSTLNPVPTDVAQQILVVRGLITQRDNTKALLKNLTEQIHVEDSELNDIFIDQWMSQTQTAIAGDTTKAKVIGWGIKGIDNGLSSKLVIDGPGSSPVIVKIDLVLHGQHVLHIHNNITGKIGHPKNILRIDVYGQTGGTQPTDLASLIANGGGYLGTAKRGKYISLFTGNTNKEEYYVVVYVDKVTLKPVAQSPVASALIN